MSNLVVACLNCLSDSESLGDRKELEDDDGIVVGLAYMKRVVLALNEISL